jgi:hypothetical protein
MSQGALLPMDLLSKSFFESIKKQYTVSTGDMSKSIGLDEKKNQKTKQKTFYSCIKNNVIHVLYLPQKSTRHEWIVVQIWLFSITKIITLQHNLTF